MQILHLLRSASAVVEPHHEPPTSEQSVSFHHLIVVSYPFTTTYSQSVVGKSFANSAKLFHQQFTNTYTASHHCWRNRHFCKIMFENLATTNYVVVELAFYAAPQLGRLAWGVSRTTEVGAAVLVARRWMRSLNGIIKYCVNSTTTTTMTTLYVFVYIFVCILRRASSFTVKEPKPDWPLPRPNYVKRSINFETRSEPRLCRKFFVSWRRRLLLRLLLLLLALVVLVGPEVMANFSEAD